MTLFFVHCVGEASRQAARWASVRGTASGTTTTCDNPNITTCRASASDVQSFTQQLPGMSSANTAVTVNWCGPDGVTGCTTSESNATPGNIVKVTVTYTYAEIPFFKRTPITLTNTAEKVVWQ